MSYKVSDAHFCKTYIAFQTERIKSEIIIPLIKSNNYKNNPENNLVKVLHSVAPLFPLRNNFLSFLYKADFYNIERKIG